jgi:hypothetical protein
MEMSFLLIGNLTGVVAPAPITSGSRARSGNHRRVMVNLIVALRRPSEATFREDDVPPVNPPVNHMRRSYMARLLLKNREDDSHVSS